jgi:long-subunit acyl-CoA synthetase (AMP-forming)
VEGRILLNFADYPSTGVPKGAIKTDKNFNQFICSQVWMPNPLCHISYAPLAHAMERQHIGMILTFGGRIGFYQGVIFYEVEMLK